MMYKLPTVNIIGAGNVGKTIGYLLVKYDLANIGSVCNTSAKSSSKAIEFIGKGHVAASISELSAADITLITTPDSQIIETSEALANTASLKKGSIIMHCSGALTSDALIAVKNKGCWVVSCHPIRSFASAPDSINDYSTTYCAIEGDKEAVDLVDSLFTSFGSILFPIEKEKKSLYHAAGVFASNYVVTLANLALSCMKGAGVNQEIAMHAITSLMKGTLLNLEKSKAPEKSLTGPIQRGDVLTIKKHLNALIDPNAKKIYEELGRATLLLTSHQQTIKEEITNALQSDGE
jgi:predicted short-subunit dehydrogenase-like oxidoreductase (DUF2520 family)